MTSPETFLSRGFESTPARAAFGGLLALGLALAACSSTAGQGQEAAPDADTHAPPGDDGAANVDAGSSSSKKDAGTKDKDAAKHDDRDPDAADPLPDAGVVAACSTQQLDDFPTSAEKAALLQKFVTRNGSAWASMLTASPVPVDIFISGIRRGERNDVQGPSVTLNQGAAAVGIAFLQKNWDLLGFRTAAGPKTIKGAFDLQDGGPNEWHLQFDSTEAPPGYEHVRNGELWLRFRMIIGFDGTVRSFEQIAITTFPPLTMAAFPTEMSPAEFRAKIDGLELYNTGIKVTPADKVQIDSSEVRPTPSGQELIFRWWTARNNKTYWWDLDGCTASVRGAGVGG